MDDSPDTASPIEVEVRDVHYARGGRGILEDFSCTFPRGRISVIAGRPLAAPQGRRRRP